MSFIKYKLSRLMDILYPTVEDNRTVTDSFIDNLINTAFDMFVHHITEIRKTVDNYKNPVNISIDGLKINLSLTDLIDTDLTNDMVDEIMNRVKKSFTFIELKCYLKTLNVKDIDVNFCIIKEGTRFNRCDLCFIFKGYLEFN